MDGRQKANAMLVFLDTEFTDLLNPELLSLGLATLDGREFYAERTDYNQDDCSRSELADRVR